MAIIPTIPDEVIKIVRQIVMITFILTALAFLGSVINTYLLESGAFNYLVGFFILIQRTFSLLNFMLDVPTLIRLIGINFFIFSLYWLVKAVIFLSSYFNQK